MAAEAKTSSKVAISEMVGLVLAIVTTRVKPPAAAAKAPCMDVFFMSLTGFAEMHVNIDQNQVPQPDQ